MKQNKVVLNHYDYMVSKTEEIKGSICQRLKNIRKYFGFNQAEFAEYLGYHPKYVSSILSGKKNPKHAELIFTAALDRMIAEKTKQS